MNYSSPIDGLRCELLIRYPDVTYGYFKDIKEFKGDSDITRILDVILEDLDCTRIYSGMRVRMTNQSMYRADMSDYYFYLCRIDNQILYNKYLDKLLDRHIDNLKFEYANPYIADTKEKKKTNKSTSKPNKYIRKETVDMFTNETTYMYYNPKTGHTIYDTSPDKLDELNGKVKKKKEPRARKSSVVPLSSMTFSFKR